MKRVLAIILGGGKGSRLYPLTKMRAKPAVPLAGKYRLIDIPISNCINSGIEKINLSNRLKFIDIGVPRNISNDVNQHEFVKSFDVDDLQEVVSRNKEFRQKIAKEAESLVEEERIIFLEWWASLEAVPVINKLRSDLELIRKEELQKALSIMGPDFSARERKVVEALTKGIINKILHTPVTKLRSPQSREERQVSLKIVEKLFSLVEEEQNN